MTSKLALLLLVLGGCALGTDDPTFKWDFGTHPEAVLEDGSKDPVWTKMVEDARAKWSAPLVTMGCPDPFRGDNTHPVFLISDDHWNSWSDPTAIGQTESTYIVVKTSIPELQASRSYETVLPHELGHALGLGHVLDNSDPDSVMHTPSNRTVPSAKDLAHVAELLGCGP